MWNTKRHVCFKCLYFWSCWLCLHTHEEINMTWPIIADRIIVKPVLKEAITNILWSNDKKVTLNLLWGKILKCFIWFQFTVLLSGLLIHCFGTSSISHDFPSIKIKIHALLSSQSELRIKLLSERQLLDALASTCANNKLTLYLPKRNWCGRCVCCLKEAKHLTFQVKEKM